MLIKLADYEVVSVTTGTVQFSLESATSISGDNIGSFSISEKGVLMVRDM